MAELMTIEEADKLYERYGKPLEKDHHREYAAITKDGRVVVGKDDIDVIDRAIQQLGRGNFVLYMGDCWKSFNLIKPEKSR